MISFESITRTTQGVVAAVPLRKCWGPVLKKWDALHVERHGKYSVERMYRCKAYCERTSFLRTAAVLVLTPLPCLVIALLMDLLPLEPPERGIAHSGLFWLRLLLVSWLILFAVMKQCRHFIVRLPMTMMEIVIASFFVALGATASAFYLSTKIGFPLPFTIGLESPAAFVLLVAAMLVLWGKHLRKSKSLQRELLNYVLVIATQLTFTYVYPAYTFVFRTLDPVPQVALALLLPAMKIVAKNWMSFLLQDLEDLKPELIIFNVEVFHALFVSSCMQSAASYSTTLILMSTDFFFGALALRRILKTVRQFHASIGANSSHLRSTSSLQHQQQHKSTSDAAVQWSKAHFLEVALYILETDPNLLRSRAISMYSQATLRRLSQIQSNDGIVAAATTTASVTQAQQPSNKTRSSVSTRFKAERSARVSQSLSSCVQESETNKACEETGLKAHHTQGPTLPQLQSMIGQTQPVTPSPKQQMQRLGRLHSVRSQIDTLSLAAKLSEHDKGLVASLDDHDRLRYVQHVLRLLFWAEFILLIEFTEMIAPVVYSIYLALVFQLPNRPYDMQLKDVDADKLRANLSVILLYALLEA
ncbi:reverse transcriptase, partial [Globisporangium polare]